MPVFVPVPAGRSLVQALALLIILMVVLLFIPVWWLAWPFPAGRQLLTSILPELREWLRVVLGDAAPNHGSQSMRRVGIPDTGAPTLGTNSPHTPLEMISPRPHEVRGESRNG